MSVIDRSIERIDDPPVVGFHFRTSRFFSKKIVIGKMTAEFSDDKFFGIFIDLRNKIGHLSFFVFDMTYLSDVFF